MPRMEQQKIDEETSTPERPLPTLMRRPLLHWPTHQRWLALAAVVSALLGLVWLLYTVPRQAAPTALLPATPAETLLSGVVASMDSPLFAYSPGWTIDERGADPIEPIDPWLTPSGVVSFEYFGDELSLQLAVGNFWGYLFVTVDGEPANLLPIIDGNVNSLGERAGYRTFLEPEAQTDQGPASRWVRVHRAEGAPGDRHQVRVEVWRSWGQTPLRGVAIDQALSSPALPIWPGVALLIGAFWSALAAWSVASSAKSRLANRRAVGTFDRLRHSRFLPAFLTNGGYSSRRAAPSCWLPAGYGSTSGGWLSLALGCWRWSRRHGRRFGWPLCSLPCHFITP
ncbi:MAG: hypothetical protein HC802_01370 [Caldilineaceae bacterium]|nr:hypothetical protein [Caldilineaceae bacterium]